MKQVSDIIGIAVTMDVDGTRNLLVMVHQDGAVNRIGDGSAAGGLKDMFMGRVSPSLLPAVVGGLTNDMLQHTGSYEIAGQAGPVCRLSIVLWFSDGAQDGFLFQYREASEGPPLEIVTFVRHAVHVTNPWYQAQTAMVLSRSAVVQKRWWELWK